MNTKLIVAIAPSGALVVLRPLYFIGDQEPLEKMQGYSIFLADTSQPAAFCLDYGEEQCPFFSPKVLDNLEVLGEL